MDEIVLDAVDGIKFPKSSPPTNNFQELYNLRGGVLWLHGQVLTVERDCKRKGLIFGVGIPGCDDALLSCFFQWFAVSLVNHCRLIGTLDFLRRERLKDSALRDERIVARAKHHTSGYVKKVCPEVLLWRNKVSAHFSMTDVHSGDRLPAMQTGISLNVGISGDRIRTGTIQWEGSHLPRWSVTEETERLASRYWPDFKVHSPFAMG